MTDPSASIQERIDRLEEIAETLEAGTVDLATARDLREEADEHMLALREQLDVGDGDVIEVDQDGEAAAED